MENVLIARNGFVVEGSTIFVGGDFIVGQGRGNGAMPTFSGETTICVGGNIRGPISPEHKRSIILLTEFVKSGFIKGNDDTVVKIFVKK